MSFPGISLVSPRQRKRICRALHAVLLLLLILAVGLLWKENQRQEEALKLITPAVVQIDKDVARLKAASRSAPAHAPEIMWDYPRKEPNP